MMLPQSKGNNSFLRRGVKSCFYCGKPSYIAHFCYKAKNLKVDNKFTFVMCNKAYSRNVCKWILDSKASKHMTSHRTTFDIKVIAPSNVCLDDNKVVKAIGMGSICEQKSLFPFECVLVRKEVPLSTLLINLKQLMRSKQLYVRSKVVELLHTCMITTQVFINT